MLLESLGYFFNEHMDGFITALVYCGSHKGMWRSGPWAAMPEFDIGGIVFISAPVLSVHPYRDAGAALFARVAGIQRAA